MSEGCANRNSLALFITNVVRCNLLQEFYALSKQEQANLVWDELFVRRLPLSEACRGVLTTMTELGQGEHLQRRDLAAIREWTRAQDPESYVNLVR